MAKLFVSKVVQVEHEAPFAVDGVSVGTLIDGQIAEAIANGEAMLSVSFEFEREEWHNVVQWHMQKANDLKARRK